MEALTKCMGNPSNGSEGSLTTTTLVTTTVAATIAFVTLSRYALWPRRQRIIRGPLTTSLPKIPQTERAGITYKHDHFPGGRDVETPYGSIHVYEFGPEDGRKVVFVHGISTSCMTLEDIVHPLVKRGCRVMLFDLFGRGYSDAPGDVEYDTRLYTTQILLVLASSQLSWTGHNAFSIIGYSLGGGIAANFAAAFPHMVETLILLAPAGLIRPANFGRTTRLIFTSGVIPERILAFFTKRRLRTPIANAVAKRKPVEDGPGAKKTNAGTPLLPRLDSGGGGGDKETLADVALQEVVDDDDDPLDHADAEPTAFEKRVGEFVHWTLEHHEGFVPAFMSTVQFAPMLDQQESWRKLARRQPGTTAVLLGRHDTLVNKEDYREDALPLIGGEDNVFWRVVPGGHNFPFTHPKKALEQIYEFWGWEQDA